MKAFWILLAVIICQPVVAQTDRSAGARQGHGFAFEAWVRETFFPAAAETGYTDKWDIPAEFNEKYGGIPVNPKATQFRQPVGLGDAIRQFEINEPFLLILGYWERVDGARRWVKAHARRVEPEEWRALWHPVTRADLEKLDAAIKDRSLSPEEARAKAQEIKGRPPFTEAVITVNPKIDSKTQRRLQCSLSYAKVVEHLGMTPDAEERPELFGESVPK